MNKLEYYYNKIPQINCQKKCHGTCGLILMSEVEFKVIDKLAGFDFLEKVTENAKNGCLTCPLLKEKRCTIYDNRPAICRLYGVTERLKCAFGCKPRRYLSDKEARRILKKIDELKTNEHAI